MKNRLLIYFKLFAYAPIINLVFFLILLLCAYFTVGKLPTYGNPDPKNFEFIYLLYLISWLALVSSYIFFPLLFCIIKFELRLKLRYLLIYMLTFFVLLFLYRNETLNFKDWILD